MQANGQTDTTKLRVAFRNFSKASKKLSGAQLHNNIKARQNGCYIMGDKKRIRETFGEGMVILKERRRKDNPIMFCSFTRTRQRRRHECKNHINCIMKGGEWAGRLRL